MIMKRKQGGYSLIELVIYIALFAVLSVVLVKSLVTVMRTYGTSKRYRALQNNGELVMERITRELREGTTATTSSCATTIGTLSIASTDASSTSHTNAFAVQNGIVQLTTDGGTANNISTSEVSATALTFCPITTATTTAVKVTLTLNTLANSNSTSASFYSTIILRGQ